MCLGGHLAFRAAFDKRIKAAVCYFATDIHSHTLGHGKNDDSLDRVKDITGELIMVRVSSQPSTHNTVLGLNMYASQIFGKKDTHVPPQGRDLIRKTLHDAGVTFSFYEPAWAQHAFIRDELSKYVQPVSLLSPTSAHTTRNLSHTDNMAGAATTQLSPASASRCCWSCSAGHSMATWGLWPARWRSRRMCVRCRDFFSLLESRVA